MLTDHNAIVFWFLSLRWAGGEDIQRVLDKFAEGVIFGEIPWRIASDPPMPSN